MGDTASQWLGTPQVKEDQTQSEKGRTLSTLQGWHKLTWDDIPSRNQFRAATLKLLRAGVTNSDRMRDIMRRSRKLILSQTTGLWNSNPTDKFVNEHAWCLEQLVEEGVIVRVGTKEYRLANRPPRGM